MTKIDQTPSNNYTPQDFPKDDEKKTKGTNNGGTNPLNGESVTEEEKAHTFHGGSPNNEDLKDILDEAVVQEMSNKINNFVDGLQTAVSKLGSFVSSKKDSAGSFKRLASIMAQIAQTLLASQEVFDQMGLTELRSALDLSKASRNLKIKAAGKEYEAAITEAAAKIAGATVSAVASIAGNVAANRTGLTDNQREFFKKQPAEVGKIFDTVIENLGKINAEKGKLDANILKTDADQLSKSGDTMMNQSQKLSQSAQAAKQIAQSMMELFKNTIQLISGTNTAIAKNM